MSKTLLSVVFLLCNLSLDARDIKSEFYETLHDEAARNITLRFFNSFLVGAGQGTVNGYLTKPNENAFTLYATTLVSAQVVNGVIHKQITPKPIDLWGMGCGESIAHVATAWATGKPINAFTFLNSNMLIAAAGTGLWLFQKNIKHQKQS